MKKQPDYYYYNTSNLMNDMIHLDKLVNQPSQLSIQKFKPQPQESKPIYHYPNNQTVARNQSHYQSSSIIHNLSHTLSNSPQQDHIRAQPFKSKHNYKPQLQKDASVYSNHSSFIFIQLSQQKLSSILSFMTTKADFKTLKQTVQIINEQKRRKSGAEQPPETSEPETTKNLRKNQSMSDLPLTVSKTPNPSPLLQHYNGIIKKGASNSKIKRQNVSTNSFSKSNIAKQSNFEKMKIKIKKLLKDKKNPNDDNNLEFQNKFNNLLLQITQSIMNDTSGQTSQPPSSQDSLSNIQIEQVFKQQFQINTSYGHLKQEKQQLEQQMNQLKTKNEQMLIQTQVLNKQLEEQKADKERLIQTYENLLENKNQEINLLKDDQINEEKNELKSLVQGQFEAIQKLLQREQLLKVFLKRVGDSSIIKYELLLINSKNV